MAKVEPYIYNARLIRVVDGDTADAWIDCGFNISVKKRIRFMGVDTWECRTRNLEEKNIPYEEINIDSQGISRNRLMELTGRLAIPTIVVNEKVIGGYTDLMKLYG